MSFICWEWTFIPIEGFKKFESVFRISRNTFNYICSLVKEDLMARPSYTDIHGKPLSLNDQVAVALRRLSSAMEERGLHHLNWPSNEIEMEEIKSKLEKIRGLPNCCGAIDITHVLMTLPTMDPSNHVWFDRENYRKVLQAVVDPEMRIRDVTAGWPGSLSDAVVLRSSGLFRLSEEGKRLNGKKLNISEGTEIREYIIGDADGSGEAQGDVEDNTRYNVDADRNRLPRIVLVCCLLHNILIDLEDEVLDDMSLSHHNDIGYRRQNCESFDQPASVTRDKLSLYLTGKLPP
ncbi:Detected protein of unknown function [Hibiscus syriacus]|uniref:DDE Tnp4 domain-containing protein n=1 Tax=Hibiscus syriacus TaxID=106335 RepID=A0A6A2X651_HIBSY|nr:Detected protein of unknown function [Hibiscus syriacus]